MEDETLIDEEMGRRIRWHTHVREQLKRHNRDIPRADFAEYLKEAHGDIGDNGEKLADVLRAEGFDSVAACAAIDSETLKAVLDEHNIGMGIGAKHRLLRLVLGYPPVCTYIEVEQELKEYRWSPSRRRNTSEEPVVQATQVEQPATTIAGVEITLGQKIDMAAGLCQGAPGGQSQRSGSATTAGVRESSQPSQSSQQGSQASQHSRDSRGKLRDMQGRFVREVSDLQPQQARVHASHSGSLTPDTKGTRASSVATTVVLDAVPEGDEQQQETEQGTEQETGEVPQQGAHEKTQGATTTGLTGDWGIQWPHYEDIRGNNWTPEERVIWAAQNVATMAEDRRLIRENVKTVMEDGSVIYSECSAEVMEMQLEMAHRQIEMMESMYAEREQIEKQRAAQFQQQLNDGDRQAGALEGQCETVAAMGQQMQRAAATMVNIAQNFQQQNNHLGGIAAEVTKQTELAKEQQKKTRKKEAQLKQITADEKLEKDDKDAYPTMTRTIRCSQGQQQLRQHLQQMGWQQYWDNN